MKVLVTGGAGYIGSHLVDELVSRNHDVVVLDDLSTGNERNLDQSRDRIEFVRGTILDADVVDQLVRGVDTVFHLAAAVGVANIMRHPLESILTNVRGSDVVFESCMRHDTRVLFTSTSEVYGKATKMPLSEDDDRVLGSTGISRWSYSTAKALDEHLALEYGRRGLPVSIIRYFNSYGPRLDPRGYGSVLANFIRQALAGEPITVHGDGTQTRCFTYVSDTVEGTIRAGLDPAALGLVFNVGNDTEISIGELAELVRVVTGSSSPIVHVSHESHYGSFFEDTKRRVPDLARAREVLGYRPSVTLQEGLPRVLEWWSRNAG